jgi:UDP-N-acetylmuramate: L-alanyl-gamma-D-glutamyl-meso-diaminopimelate ligase
LFVLEGDEYDTAFFDKGSKFLHYRPQGLIINAIEFDHADIFANLEKIVEQFEKVIRLVPDPRLIAVNSDDPVVVGLMDRLGLSSKVIKVSPYSNSSSAGLRVAEYKPGGPGAAADPTSFTLETKCWGRLRVNTNLNGRYNAANIAHAVAVLQGLVETGFWTKAPGASALVEAIAEFSGVRRRLDHLGSVKGIDIFEDFAHHPTAVNHVIETMRASGVGRRLLVAFEPRNATGRRNTFEKEYAEVFRKADGVWIGECPLDKRIPEELRMNTLRLASAIGSHAAAFETNDQLVESLATAVKPGDMVVFMTSSSFSGAQHRITGMLKERFGG